VCWPFFAYFAHFLFLRDVLIRSQRAAGASKCAANLTTHLPNLATHLSPYLATHLTNLATYLSFYLATHLPNLATHLSPYLATHLPNLAAHLPQIVGGVFSQSSPSRNSEFTSF
jgi:hypothetical protein